MRKMTKKDVRAISLFEGKRTRGVITLTRGRAKELFDRFGDIPVVEAARLLDSNTDEE